MYVNQLIISFVVFGVLLYLMTCEKKRETFYNLNQGSIVPSYSNYTNDNKYIPQNKALYYRPGHPYFTYPDLPPQPLTNIGNYKSFNTLQQSKKQFDMYNMEGFGTDNIMNPKINNGSTTVVKITFFLMLVGLIYYLYQNKNSTLE